MGDSVKELHDCPRVPLNMTASLIPEMTWFTGSDHYHPDTRCDQNGSMPDLCELHAQPQFVSTNPITIWVVFESPFDSGRPHDSHVRYDSSHSNN